MSTILQPNLLHTSQFHHPGPSSRSQSCLTSPPSTQASTPRTPSIRFAPLPDPRASRANVPGGYGGSDVWWSREEKPDGTWGDYRLVLRRPNGEIVAIDDLALGSHERTQALETYRRQQTKLSPQQALPKIVEPSTSDHHYHHSSNPKNITPQSHTTPSSNLLDQISSQTDTRFAKLLPPLVTQSQTLPTHPTTCPTPAGSSGHSLSLTLIRTTSHESTYSNHSVGSNYKSASNSLTRKFIEAMKKPLAKQSHRLTPTNSLPIDCSRLADSQRGLPLSKSRSDEPASSSGSIRKGFHFGLLKKHPSAQLLRRTQSKEETSFLAPSLIPYNEPPTRRRSNYPPVAQRKIHMGGGRGGAGKLTVTEEPDFVEWKPAAAAASPGRTSASPQAPGPGDDDGSGMAWLRKRKREREERAQREEAERVKGLRDSSALITASAQAESQKLEAGLAASLSTDCATLSSIFPISEEDKLDEDRASTSSSISQSSTLSHDGPQRSAGTRTSTSSTTESSKHSAADDEDLNEEELKEEERLKLLALTQSPFVRGATEVYRDREHHQVSKRSSELTRPISQ
ncbi:hypothetical protein PCANC_16203 [Puccinia coronata f. sp. avenae]|uniref:Uncharacterized protein n=1 Tax=Puccinia coronata f. sp. avenae TaxID=200324 RepID=A0A2N5UF74_9BASI|nr:hypothetical protein PCANC_16203 [Puccinia coronata f. sp. avenae]